MATASDFCPSHLATTSPRCRVSSAGQMFGYRMHTSITPDFGVYLKLSSQVNFFDMQQMLNQDGASGY